MDEGSKRLPLAVYSVGGAVTTLLIPALVGR